MPSFTSFVTLLSLSAGAFAAVIPRDDSATGVTHTGDITFYNTEGGTGACGTTLADTDSICALSTTLYDEYTQNGDPNNNSLCGKQIKITMPGGATATVTVADRCEACSMWDLDLTPTVFDAIVSGGASVGRTQTSWEFVS